MFAVAMIKAHFWLCINPTEEKKDEKTIIKIKLFKTE